MKSENWLAFIAAILIGASLAIGMILLGVELMT